MVLYDHLCGGNYSVLDKEDHWKLASSESAWNGFNQLINPTGESQFHSNKAIRPNYLTAPSRRVLRDCIIQCQADWFPRL